MDREDIFEQVPVLKEVGIHSGGGAVNSVNGQTGDVILDAEDVGAVDTTTYTNKMNELDATDSGLQSQIDAITVSSDVTDIVGTYADLEAYDTSKLNDNDIIKVLQDETHDGETAYYRWSKTTETFTLIGEEGPYYTKSAADQKFQEKLTAGDNVQINGNTISATDTTYSNFTGTDGVDAGAAGLVPAPATTDAGKFLKADGTWDSAGGGGGATELTADTNLWELTPGDYYVNQSANIALKYGSGSSQKLDVFQARFTILNSGYSSQPISVFGVFVRSGSNGQLTIFNGTTANSSNAKVFTATIANPGLTARNFPLATLNDLYRNGDNTTNLQIGYSAASQSDSNGQSLAIGRVASTASRDSVALGAYTEIASNTTRSVALGAGAKPTRQGEVNIGIASAAIGLTNGFDGTAYRVIGGVHDPQLAQDAATKNYVDTLISALEARVIALENN